MLFRLFYRLVLERVPPEGAHALASWALRALGAVPGGRAAVRRLAFPRDGSLEVRALGLAFPTPLGVAAGVDKTATWFEELGAIGFGFVEVGTVTAVAQRGEPKPRVARVPAERALVNRMGFPNPGAQVFARRLARRAGETIVGVNIGKSRIAPLDEAAADYIRTVRVLGRLADYVVVNVSSPNTPGLRDMQAVDRLRPLLTAVRGELRASGARAPLLVKISPDLSDEDLDAIADLALELSLDGVVAVNTTVDRSALSASTPQAESIGGGISGAPLKPRALAVLERLYARVGDRLVLVSVGGIETAGDAWARILAGATLLQANTGFVYGGPAWPARINRGLARRVRDAGATSIQELVGVGAHGHGATAAGVGLRSALG
jgi:dihydroorotate dehydrogenase